MLHLVGYTWKYVCDARGHERQKKEKQLFSLVRNRLFISSFLGQDIFPRSSSSNDEVSHSSV